LYTGLFNEWRKVMSNVIIIWSCLWVWEFMHTPVNHDPVQRDSIQIVGEKK
jgi:hypothetical protein